MPGSHAAISPRGESRQRPGRVVLVGAGPGAPDLITRRGAAWLSQADLIVYDYLANAALLSHARHDAETICLGKHGTGRLWNQEQINETLVREALRGRLVVRLKGGDPSIFGCAAQEIEALQRAGIDFEVVPGVTAAIGAAAIAGIPLTHRDHASAVAFVTGSEDRDKQQSSLDFHALAHFPGTLVFYMGTTTVETWSRGLLEFGKPPETPVAIVRHATLPDQSVITTYLGDVVNQVRTTPKLRPPVVFIVGETAHISHHYAWTATRPLSGRLCLVPRPAGTSETLLQSITDLGGVAIACPVTVVMPPQDEPACVAAFRRGCCHDWVLFTSINGAQASFRLLESAGRDSRWFANASLAAIGPATQQALRAYGLMADLVPERHDSEGLVAALKRRAAPSSSLLLLRGERTRGQLVPQLRDAGFHVDELIVYRTVDIDAPDPQILDRMKAGKLDWVFVTSVAIGQALYTAYGSALHQCRLVSISPRVTQELKNLGYQVAAEAHTATTDSMLDAVLQWEMGADD